MQSRIDLGGWVIPEVFHELRELGNIEDDEMFRVFNMGIGMVFIVDEHDAKRTLEILNNSGFNSWDIGTVMRNDQDCTKRIRIS